MEKRLFERALKKFLKRKLPQSREYVNSRRIEGLLMRDEELIPFKNALLLVDEELDSIAWQNLFDTTYEALYSENIFRQGRYNIAKWTQSGINFENIRKSGFVRITSLKRIASELNIQTKRTTDFDKLALESMLRKFNVVFVFSTEEKVKALKLNNIGLPRNMVVIYQSIVDEDNSNYQNNCYIGLDIASED